MDLDSVRGNQWMHKGISVMLMACDVLKSPRSYFQNILLYLKNFSDLDTERSIDGQHSNSQRVSFVTGSRLCVA